jgi:hypothetical protein
MNSTASAPGNAFQKFIINAVLQYMYLGKENLKINKIKKCTKSVIQGNTVNSMSIASLQIIAR